MANEKRDPALVREDLRAAYTARVGVAPPELVVEHDRVGNPRLRVSLYFSLPDDAEGHAAAIDQLLEYFEMAVGKAREHGRKSEEK